MASKWIEQWRLKNETMRKLIGQLEVSTDWIYDGEVEYTHNESDIIIKWGKKYNYDSSTTYRRVINPVRIRIPFRFRKEIGKKIRVIYDRHTKPSGDVAFFNDYMDGLYTQQIKITGEQKSKITAWMLTNGIYEWHIIGNVIWFKNEEDAVAVKLVCT